MREKNGMLEPPYCFFYSSVQALTLRRGSFLLCFAMPGILCRGEITVTCQSSIKRGEKIPALTFSRSLVFQTRTGPAQEREKNTGKGPRERERAERQECQVSVQCPVFQAHPKLILHLLSFLCVSLRPWHPFTLQPSVLPHTTSLPQEAKHGFTHSVWRRAVFPPRWLTVKFTASERFES